MRGDRERDGAMKKVTMSPGECDAFFASIAFALFPTASPVKVLRGTRGCETPLSDPRRTRSLPRLMWSSPPCTPLSGDRLCT